MSSSALYYQITFLTCKTMHTTMKYIFERDHKDCKLSNKFRLFSCFLIFITSAEQKPSPFCSYNNQ